jgi:hypothetical protein
MACAIDSGLSGVDGHVDVVVAHELERRPVVLRRVVVLRAGEVEADDAAALVGDGELRHLQRVLGGHVADPADDDVRLDAVLLLGLPQSLEHALDDGGQLEAATGVEHGRVADLHVADVLARRVLGELVRDAPQRVLGLHHAQSDVEGLEVLDERAAVLAEVHDGAQALCVTGGQVHPLVLAELEDRRETERAVEVDVEIRLGELLDELEGDGAFLCTGHT